MSSFNASNDVQNDVSLPQLARVVLEVVRLVQAIDPRVVDHLRVIAASGEEERRNRNTSPCGTCSAAKVKVSAGSM